MTLPSLSPMTSRFSRWLCRTFGHRWNCHGFAVPKPEDYGRWFVVENTHCRRCGDPGPEFTWHRAASPE